MRWLAGVAVAARFGHSVDTAASVALVAFGSWIAARLELSIYEAGVPPQIPLTGAIADAVTAETLRPDGVRQIFRLANFAGQEDVRGHAAIGFLIRHLEDALVHDGEHDHRRRRLLVFVGAHDGHFDPITGDVILVVRLDL